MRASRPPWMANRREAISRRLGFTRIHAIHKSPCRSSTTRGCTRALTPTRSSTSFTTSRAPTSNIWQRAPSRTRVGDSTSNIRLGSRDTRSPSRLLRNSRRGHIVSLTTRAHGRFWTEMILTGSLASGTVLTSGAGQKRTTLY